MTENKNTLKHTENKPEVIESRDFYWQGQVYQIEKLNGFKTAPKKIRIVIDLEEK